MTKKLYRIEKDGTVPGLNKYYSGFDLFSILAVSVPHPDGTNERVIEALCHDNGDMEIPIPTWVVETSTGSPTHKVGHFMLTIKH